MAVLWFFLVTLGAVLLAGVIRRRLWPARLRRRLLLPLAVVQRSVADALGELCGNEDDEAPTAEVFVSPFEPLALRLARVPEADLVSVGQRAVENRRKLVDAIHAWNAAAGRTQRPAALLPLILAAHQAARELSEQLGDRPDGAAFAEVRRQAQGRILFSLIGPAEPGDGWRQ